MEYLPKDSTIIFAVLNWGLGHATRSIPLIEKLIERNNKIVIASDGIALDYLKNNFQYLEFIILSPYNIKYPFQSIAINMALQFYKPIVAMYREHKEIEKVVGRLNPDYIITDNRYGCYAKKTKNIILTHQIESYHKSGIFRVIFNYLSKKFISPFDEVWVPDDENNKLSGELSHYTFTQPKVRFIGLLSRMVSCEKVNQKYITLLLSGPEPQRTYFEKELMKMVDMNPNHEFILIRGSKETHHYIPKTNLKIIDIAQTKELNQILCESKMVICRSGYSTLMDLKTLNKKAIVVPTPGQVEQEYLAEINSHHWVAMNQNKVGSLKLVDYLI